VKTSAADSLPSASAESIVCGYVDDFFTKYRHLQVALPLTSRYVVPGSVGLLELTEKMLGGKWIR
jgi:hypothetical protein